MNKELSQKLFEKYPTIFRDRNKRPTETLICFGLECGSGWFKLLDELCAELTQIEQESGLQTIAVQVKEKFGTLRFYTNGGHDADRFSMETNTRHWLLNICAWMHNVGKWSDELTPWQEYYGTKLCEYETKRQDGTVYQETVRDWDNVIATPWVKVKHAVISFIRSKIWHPFSWYLNRFVHVHYRRVNGDKVAHGWHRWNPKKYHKRIEAAICKAENSSAVTCEECGKPGTLDTRYYYIQTLCEECQRVRGEEMEGRASMPKTADELEEKIVEMAAEGQKIAEEIELNARITEAEAITGRKLTEQEIAAIKVRIEMEEILLAAVERAGDKDAETHGMTSHTGPTGQAPWTNGKSKQGDTVEQSSNEVSPT